MTAQEKKDLINKRLSQGDTRSYNEIAADLELEIWAERHNAFPKVRNKVKGK